MSLHLPHSLRKLRVPAELVSKALVEEEDGDVQADVADGYIELDAHVVLLVCEQHGGVNELGTRVPEPARRAPQTSPRPANGVDYENALETFRDAFDFGASEHWQPESIGQHRAEHPAAAFQGEKRVKRLDIEFQDAPFELDRTHEKLDRPDVRREVGMLGWKIAGMRRVRRMRVGASLSAAQFIRKMIHQIHTPILHPLPAGMRTADAGPSGSRPFVEANLCVRPPLHRARIGGMSTAGEIFDTARGLKVAQASFGSTSVSLVTTGRHRRDVRATFFGQRPVFGAPSPYPISDNSAPIPRCVHDRAQEVMPVESSISV